ncbi:ribonuclease H2, subunit B [Limtongia smithiae]|uniref:ribonuclease H2, subunit B n=1 Tax=Limtongia smithiae TaxID=1125753 RepID=UPI0034CE22AB
MTQVIILPATATSGAYAEGSTILSLPHPATSVSTRYLYSPKPRGLYELTLVDHANPHSIILTSELDASDAKHANNSCPTGTEDKGSVISSAQICIATIISPQLLLLPVLFRYEAQFRVWEDISDALMRTSASFELILDFLEQHVSTITDIEEPAEGLKCYRLSRPKLFAHFWTRAKRMASHLPDSIVKSQIERKLAPARYDISTPQEMYQAARHQTALTMLAAYFPPQLMTEFLAAHAEEKQKLATYIEELNEQRAEEMMLQSAVSDRKPAKRKFEDADAAAAAAAKEKATSKSSKGVRMLNKVDKSGMSKLSTFFKKK